MVLEAKLSSAEFRLGMLQQNYDLRDDDLGTDLCCREEREKQERKLADKDAVIEDLQAQLNNATSELKHMKA